MKSPSDDGTPARRASNIQGPLVSRQQQSRIRPNSRPSIIEGAEVYQREPEYQAPPVAVPSAQAVRPSVVNNQPLTGWHRNVILAGAIMSPFDAYVIHWPPDDRAQPLRSKAEVQNWLVTHGHAKDTIDDFNFGPAACLSDFPDTDGGPTPFGELPPSSGSLLGNPRKYLTRDFWVEEVCGYPIRRFFDFEGPSAFRQRYSTYLTQFRRAVQEELLVAVAELFEGRKGEDVRRLERIKKLREAYAPQDPGVFGLRGQFMSLECVNLLHQCSASRSEAELLESPHIAKAHPGCFSFRLFTPAFCSRLVNEVRHFDASCSGEGNNNNSGSGGGDGFDARSAVGTSVASSGENSHRGSRGGGGGGSEGSSYHGGGSNNGFEGGAAKLGRPKTSDGLVMRRGVLLEEMGLSEGFTDVLLARVVRPLARLLFPDSGGPSLDNHLAFALAQSPGNNSGRLFPKSYHRQVLSGGMGRGGVGAGGGAGDGPFELMEGNAEVMLVVCLSGGACGGDLVLYGPRDAPRPGGMAKVPLSRLEQPLDPAEAAAAADAVAEEAAEAAAVDSAGEVGSGAATMALGSFSGRDEGRGGQSTPSRGRLTPERGEGKRSNPPSSRVSPDSRRGVASPSPASPSRATRAVNDRTESPGPSCSQLVPPPPPQGWESGVGPGLGGIGEAVMFSGDELHRFEALDQHRSGDRVLLVVWARSSSWRSEYRTCDDQRPVRDSSYLYL